VGRESGAALDEAQEGRGTDLLGTASGGRHGSLPLVDSAPPTEPARPRDHAPSTGPGGIPRPTLAQICLLVLLVQAVLLAALPSSHFDGADDAIRIAIAVADGLCLIALASAAVVHLNGGLRAARRRSREQERRLLAAELHDLVLQDLALAVAQARSLQSRVPEAASVVEAGDRALRAARQLSTGLSRAGDGTIFDALHEAVAPIAERAGVALELNVAEGEVRPASREALVGIAREAVTNAVKHGAPSRVELDLERGEAWALRVTDDGRGFDPDNFLAGLGLVGMRQRALAAGGELRLRTAPDSGTILEAVLP
jgi:signal transduction histidine kinase